VPSARVGAPVRGGTARWRRGRCGHNGEAGRLLAAGPSARRPGGQMLHDALGGGQQGTPSILVLEDVFDCDTVFKTQF
jgi:hypothetical protein